MAACSGYCCYVLHSSAGGTTRTYTGSTNDLSRRFRQHNGEIKGGARATRMGRPWLMLCSVCGFRNKIEALCCEWRLKKQRARKNNKLIPTRGGIQNRCRNVLEVLSLERWTQSSPPAKEIQLLLTWYAGARRPPNVRLPPYVREEFMAGEFVPLPVSERKSRGRKRKSDTDSSGDENGDLDSTSSSSSSSSSTSSNSRSNSPCSSPASPESSSSTSATSVCHDGREPPELGDDGVCQKETAEPSSTHNDSPDTSKQDENTAAGLVSCRVTWASRQLRTGSLTIDLD